MQLPTPAPALLELRGCGAVTAVKPLAEIGPIDPFKSDAQLARHGGVAPLEAIRCLKRILVRVVFNTLKTSPP